MRAPDVHAANARKPSIRSWVNDCSSAKLIHAAFQHVPHARCQPGQTNGVWRAGLVFVGQEIRLKLVFRATARAAVNQCRQARVVEILPQGQAAGAGRTEHRLVPGEGQQIDVVGVHVDRPTAGGLGRVHQQGNAAGMGQRADLAHRQHCAAHIRGVVHDDQAGVRPEALGHGSRLHGSVGPASGEADRDAAAFEGPQRAHDGVVLHSGGDDVRAGFKQAKEREVDGGRAVMRKDDPQRVAQPTARPPPRASRRRRSAWIERR